MQQQRQPRQAVHHEEEDLQAVRDGVEQRQKTIVSLTDYANEFDKLSKEKAESEMKSSIPGIIGGGLTMAGGIVTIATGGAAAPIILAALGGLGTAASLSGGAMAIKNALDYTKLEEELKKKLKEAIQKDNDAIERMHEVLERIKRGDQDPERSNKRLIRELQMYMSGFNAIAMYKGSAIAFDILFMATPLLATSTLMRTTSFITGAASFLPKVMAQPLVEGIEEIADEVAEEAVKETMKGSTREFAKKAASEAAQKAYKKALDEAVKNATKEGMEEGAKVAAQNAAKEAAKKAGKKVAKEAAEEAAAACFKTAAKVTGGITTGFGAVSMIWDGYNCYNGWSKSMEKSELGKEVRRVVDEFQRNIAILN